MSGSTMPCCRAGDAGSAVLGVLPAEDGIQAAVIGGTFTVIVAIVGAIGLYFSQRASRRAGKIQAELRPNGGSSIYDHVERRFANLEDRLGHHDRLLERIDAKLDDLRDPRPPP